MQHQPPHPIKYESIGKMPPISSLVTRKRKAAKWTKPPKKRYMNQINEDRRQWADFVATLPANNPLQPDDPQNPTDPQPPVDPPTVPPPEQGPPGVEPVQERPAAFGGPQKEPMITREYGPNLTTNLPDTTDTELYNFVEAAKTVVGVFSPFWAQIIQGQLGFGSNSLETVIKALKQIKDTADYYKLLEELKKRQAAEAAKGYDLQMSSLDDALKKVNDTLAEIKNQNLLGGNPPEGLQKPLQPTRVGAAQLQNELNYLNTLQGTKTGAIYPAYMSGAGALTVAGAGSLGSLATSGYNWASIGSLGGSLGSLVAGSSGSAAAANAAVGAAAGAGITGGALAKLYQSFYEFAGSESDLQNALKGFGQKITEKLQGGPGALPATWETELYTPRFTNPREPTPNVWDQFYQFPGYGQPVAPPVESTPGPSTQPPTTSPSQPTPTQPTPTTPSPAQPTPTETTPETKPPETVPPPVTPAPAPLQPTQPVTNPDPKLEITKETPPSQPSQPSQPARPNPIVQPPRPSQPRRPTKRVY